MQKTLILDLIQTTAENVAGAGASSLEDIRNASRRMAVFSPVAEAERLSEKRYLYDTLYTCAELELEHSKGEQVVTELFDFWVNEPEQLPEAYFAEVDSEGLARVVADYIAGMTDNFILLQYAEVKRLIRSGRVAMPPRRL
jgi:dGTPase